MAKYLIIPNVMEIINYHNLNVKKLDKIIIVIIITIIKGDLGLPKI